MRYGLLILLGAVLLLSCGDGVGKNDFNPNYKVPMVWGWLTKVRDVELAVTYEKYFEVFDYDGLRMVPIVLLNGEQLEPMSYSPISYEYGDTNVIPANQ